MSAGSEPRIAVVGAGIVGLCTAYALRERGLRAHVYERGVPGNGQSGGESRIFRHAHDDPRLIEIAADARAIWTRWSDRLGVETVSADGSLAIGDAVPGRLAKLERAGGIDCGALDPGEAVAALPILAPFEAEAMIDRDGGAIRTNGAVEALAAALGDDLVADEVLAVRVRADGVELRSGGHARLYERVVVCAGIGTAALARSAGLQLPVSQAAHLRATFALRVPAPARLPCFQDSSGSWGESGVYAAPQPGNERYAVGLAGTTEVRDDGALVDDAALAGFERRVVGYVERALPGLDPEPLELRHCWVTRLPWGEDGLAVWRRGGALFVSGHNLFKQAPALGTALAAAAAGEALSSDLEPGARLGSAQD